MAGFRLSHSLPLPDRLLMLMIEGHWKSSVAIHLNDGVPINGMETKMTIELNKGLSKEEKSQVAGVLSKVMADAYALYLKTHGYHWNVRGPNFPALHPLFEGQYQEQWAALDDIAERIRALGEFGSAGLRRFW